MTKMKRTVLSICTLLMIAPSVLKAQDSTVNATAVAPIGTSVTAIEETLSTKSPLAVIFGLEMAEKVQKDETAPKENSVSFSIEPMYKLTPLLTASARMVINQDNFGQHETTTSDGTVALAIKGYQINPEFKTVHSVSTIVPVTEKSVKTDRLKGSISTSNGISYVSEYFNITYKLGLVRFFHDFTQNATGSPNIQYRVSHLLDITVPVTDKFYVNTVGAYRVGYTYNEFERYGFIFSGDLNYDINAKMTANLGISTDGNAVKSNGVDSNITVFDENTSSYRIGISYLY
jgi:hypothetical protein